MHLGANDVHLQRGIVANTSLPVLGLGGISGLGDELAEDALPNEIKQTMRKMSKKDATTKLKVAYMALHISDFKISLSYGILQIT